MQITASLVKELRDRTSAGMMECKKALEEANGNIEDAILSMRKKGQLKAAKRAGKITAEGIIVQMISKDARCGIMLEVNCETDFVAKDESFLAFANQVITRGLSEKVDTLDALFNLSYVAGDAASIEQTREQLVGKIGENIQLRRLAVLETTNGHIAGYRHGSRIGVLVDLNSADAELGKNIAMHIAASNPKAISSENVPAEIVAQEREIALAQAASSGKPPAVIEKMVEGRVNKFLQEISLVNQAYLKDPNQTVGDLLKSHKASVLSFVRFEVGEGIEKEKKDFAQEVMEQVQGK